MIKAVWVDENNDPTYEAIDAHQIKWLMFCGRDPRVTKTYLANQTKKGYTVGTYWAWNWYPSIDAMCDAVIAHTKQVRVSNSNPKIQIDIEAHEPDMVMSAITRIRTAYSNQDLSWTMESFQAGWMDDELVKFLVDQRVRLVPQYYVDPEHDDMPSPDNYQGLLKEQVAQDVVMKQLVLRGIPIQSISGFYDAAALPDRWDGFAFTQNRLR